MGESMDGLGLSWEQLLIAGVAFTVLIVVLFAAFRGAGRNRRARREDADTRRDRTEAPPLREPPSFAAAVPGSASRAEPSPRAEPSLGASSGPARQAQPEFAEPPAPSELPPPEPLPAFLSPPEPEPEPEPEREIARREPEPAVDDMSQFARADADNAQAVKALKGQVDELRQDNTLLLRRLEETERTLHDMQTEMQAKFASLERGAAREAPISAESPADSGVIRPPPPPPPTPPPSNEDNLERARRAIELLSRKDDEGA